MNIKRLLVLALAALLCLMVPAAFAEKTITMAMVSAWDTLMPFDTTSSYSDLVMDLLFD